ncbi:MAG: GNAT family N-acetyltransferase, partial [Oscillospiraceae bacterium]|nr:GNAT family N-acetyltransferase [Oscillospiraceae bacterium]
PETCFVAEENGQLIGCIMSGHDGRRGYIYHTCVHPDHRRKGIGRMLTDAALDALRGCRIHKVALVVFSDNTTGNAFWERMDFTAREDLVYRNRALSEMQKINT